MKKNTKDPIYKKYIVANLNDDSNLYKEIEVICEKRQTKKHIVRKMNTKSTYIHL